MCREAQTLQKRSSGSNSTNGFLASTRVLYPQCAALMIMFSSSQNFIQPQCLVVPQAGNGPVLHFRAMSGIQTGLTGVALELGVIFQPSFDNVKPSNSMELSCQNENRLFTRQISYAQELIFKFQLQLSGACMCIHEYVYTSNSESDELMLDSSPGALGTKRGAQAAQAIKDAKARLSWDFFFQTNIALDRS